jgi:hypothetical protein
MRAQRWLFPLLFLFLLVVTLAGIRSARFDSRSTESDGANSIEGLVSANRPVSSTSTSTSPLSTSDKQAVDKQAGNEQAGGGQAGDTQIHDPAKVREGQEGNGGGAASHPLDPLLAYARELKQHIEQEIVDYTAVMIKRERIGGSLGDETRMELKIRNRQLSTGTALSAYLKFLEPRAARGREVIWIENANSNRLISHEAGLLGFKRFDLEPDSVLAMLGNKYPITEIGILRLVEKLIEKGERDRELGHCMVEVIDGQRVGDRECRLFQITHPEKKPGLDFHVAQIFVDVERKIPLRYAAFMWPVNQGEPLLEEEYTYIDLKLNVNLRDIDFSPDNPEYNFP